jgi:hypothetical protein
MGLERSLKFREGLENAQKDSEEIAENESIALSRF